MKLYLKAGLTVEAAYTVSLVLLILGVWIRLAFINHDRALANAVINFKKLSVSPTCVKLLTSLSI